MSARVARRELAAGRGSVAGARAGGAFRPCAVVPTYDNPATLRAVVEGIRRHLDEVIVVDDGSAEPGRRAAAELAEAGLARLLRRPANGGKGEAVRDGLRLARKLGFTHAVQVDADGQHELADLPRFLEAARTEPRALVAGRPVFDETAPTSRRLGRVLTQLWAAYETFGPVVHDPLCGFRLYPIEAALAAGSRAERMDFDLDIAVRMHWRGTPVVNLPTRVRYLSAAEGGVSHYRMVRDNLRLGRAHAVLSMQAPLRALARALGPGRQAAERGVADERRGWLEVAERGSVLGIWFLVVLSTLGGRGPGRAFLRPLAAYYALASPGARRASRSYLERLHGRAVSATEVYEHLLRFAECTLDRLFFIRGEVGRFEVVSEGEEHLRELARSGRGAILLGAHLGSFEAMARMAEAREIRINVVGYFRNARMLNAVLERLSPSANARLVELEPEGVEFVLRIRELVEAGELVAILGDRLGRDRSRSVVVPFLGAPARLPTGPFVLAAALGCPVFLVFGLQRGGPARYELYCEPFAQRVELPRARRAEALRELAARYAARLEHHCRLAPDNWFNFFDFWEDEIEEPAAAEASPPAAVEGRTP